MAENQKPTLKQERAARAKRLLLSAVLGVAVAITCQMLPPDYQIPCRIVVKLVALFFGGK